MRPELTPQALVMGPRGQERERLREVSCASLPSIRFPCIYEGYLTYKVTDTGKSLFC